MLPFPTDPSANDFICAGSGIETWQEIALRLAGLAGIKPPHHELIEVGGTAVTLWRRFDRAGAIRHPFLSAMGMMRMKHGERGSDPEIGGSPSLVLRNLRRKPSANLRVQTNP